MLKSFFGSKVQDKKTALQDVEIYFLAYPKTGNTWLRILLGKYIQDYYKLPQLPLLDFQEQKQDWYSLYRGPVVDFTHRPLEWRDQTADDLSYGNVITPFCGKKVVLLVRHPLDVMVSDYMHMHEKIQSGPTHFSGTLVEFIEDAVWGLEKFFKYYQIWAQQRTQDIPFYVLRYEDLYADTNNEIVWLLTFMGIPAVPALVKRAVEFASFQNLQRMEKEDVALVYNSSGFKAFGKTNVSNPESFHVRKGVVGDYRSYLQPDEIKRFLGDIQKHMPVIYGYQGEDI